MLSLVLVACSKPEPAAPKPVTPAPPSATAESAPPPPSEAPVTSPNPGGHPAADAEAAKAAAEAASVGAAPTVKVTEPGAAPRKALRYKFKAGVTEYAEMDMKMSLGMTMGEKAAPKTDLPTVRSTMRIDGVELTPEGDLRCTFKTEKVDLLKDVKMDAKLREGLEKELGGLVGMHGKARISTRGIASESSFELPPNASPGLNAQLDVMRDAIRQMYVPFPEEEVGKGAKWDVTSRLPINGALVDTKLAYTLVKVDAASAQADVETSLLAPPNQAMRMGALPGATATLESLVGKGSGKVSPSLSRLVGSGTNQVSMESSFSVITKTGQQIQMKMQSDVAVISRPAAAPARARRP